MATKHQLSDNSWIEWDTISPELQQYTIDNFEQLFNLHPPNKGQIIMNKPDGLVWNSPRYHKCYGQTPAYDPKLKYSYMFTGMDNQDQRNDPLPSLFQPYLDYLNSQCDIDKYNQVVINWYASGEDYIANHSDCDIGMVDGYDIASITLGSSTYCDSRYMRFQVIQKENHNLQNKSFCLPLKNGRIIRMCGKTQQEFRHGVPKCHEIIGDMRRIGITFRKFKV